MNKEKIGIVGLGKLGLPMMAAFISRGFDTYGYDINSELIKTLRKGLNPYKEPGIQLIIDNDSQWKTRFFDKLQDFTALVDIVFLIIPTPTKSEIFDVSYLKLAFDSIVKANKKTSKKLICVITSTVNPGDSDIIQNEILSKSSIDIKLVYSPEFIALGSVLNDMLHPDVVLLGGCDNDAVDKIFSIYSRLYKSFPEFHRLSFFEAEVAKIAINTFITTKITYANTIGTFIERATSSRISSQKVLNAIGGDSRIGRKYFKYGVSYGGPCFPRDNRALTAHLRKYNVDASIPIATDKINSKLLEDWYYRIKEGQYDAIVIVGLAYKSGTDFLEESFMIKLGQLLINKLDVYYFDSLIEHFDNFSKLNNNNLNLLNQYKKVLVLNNYGAIDFAGNLNLEIINIWN